MNAETPYVYIVDDDPELCRALAWLFRVEGIETKVYHSAEAFLTHCRTGMAGCVVMDVRLTGMSGLEAQHWLVEHGIEIPIVFISGHGDVPTTRQAFLSLAVDFIQKPYEPEELLAQVRNALASAQVCQESRRARKSLRERYDSLTAREKEIMLLVGHGLSSKQIANSLGISSRTVEVHRGHLMEKMEAESLPQLVLMICDLGLLNPSDASRLNPGKSS